MPANSDISVQDDPEPGSADIDIAVMDARWENTLPNLQAICTGAAGAAAQVLETPQSADLSIALMNDTQIQNLNKQFRGKNKPTNVLSFLSDGHNPIMGDIALAYETCLREAEQRLIPLRDHTMHLLVHGYLHLSGYDHRVETEAEIMEALEIAALATLGIENPYEETNV